MNQQARYIVIGLSSILLLLLHFAFFVIPKTVSIPEQLLKGLRMIDSAWTILLVVVVIFGLCFAITIILIVINGTKNLCNEEILSLVFSGIPIVLAVLSFVVVNLKEISFILLFLFFPFIYIIAKKYRVNSDYRFRFLNPWQTALLLSLLPIFLCIRFGYIVELKYPLNIDSVNHTQIITTILANRNLITLPYYHYAFHYIIAFFNLATGIEIPELILILGQIFQTIAPLTLFYPIFHWSKSFYASFFTVLAAGFVWGMPYQAISWGKYPAVLAAVSTVFVINQLHLMLKIQRRSGVLMFLSAIILVISLFLHTRTIVLLISELFIYIGSKNFFIKGLSQKRKSLVICANMVMILFLICLGNYCFLSWKTAFEPYINVWLLVLLITLPLGMSYYFKAVFQLEMMILLCLIASTLPLPGHISIFNTNTLIDRPFLSIFLFIPLSILLGLNLAGIEQSMSAIRDQLDGEQHSRKVTIKLGWVCWAFFVVLLLLTPSSRALTSLPGANLLSVNDLLVFEEIKRKTPANAKILIPNTSPYYELGIDGGAWISFATARETIKVHYSSDLTSLIFYKKMCSLGVDYLYLGGSPYSFSLAIVQQRLEWYRPISNYSTVKLYQLISCPKNE